METNEVFKDSCENPMANFITDALAASVRVVRSDIDFHMFRFRFSACSNNSA